MGYIAGKVEYDGEGRLSFWWIEDGGDKR